MNTKKLHYVQRNKTTTFVINVGLIKGRCNKQGEQGVMSENNQISFKEFRVGLFKLSKVNPRGRETTL